MDSHQIRGNYTVMRIVSNVLVAASALFPIAFAEAQSIQGVALAIIGILEVWVVRILFALATVVFIWGMILYIAAGGSEDKAKKGKGYIIWGIVGLTVMVAVWGIVKIITATFSIGGQPAPELPDIPGA